MRGIVVEGVIIFLAVFGMFALVHSAIVLVDMLGTALWGCSCG